MADKKTYPHEIISTRSLTGEVPIEFSTGDIVKDLGEEVLTQYIALNKRTLENPKVSRIEVKIIYNQ